MKDQVLYSKDKLKRLVAWVEMKKYNILWNKCLKLDVSDKAMVSHFRFGYFNFGGLTELSKKELVLRLLSMEFERKFCEECVLIRHPWIGFPKTTEYKVE